MLFKFRQAEGFTVTIHTNSNCTLKCSYCYEYDKAASVSEDQKFWSTTKHADEKRSYDFIRKEPNNCIVPIDLVKKFLDSILEFDKNNFFKEFVKERTHDNIILDFIGGDSLQYPELLDEILTYFTHELIRRDHNWQYSWSVSISSNGVTLLNPKARKFCEKWKNNLSVGISIDGCPELHDLNRWCFADNVDKTHRGSWHYIKEIWPWYQKTFPADALRTKWTVAPNSYEYTYKSLKFLHEELGMKYVFFNRVMEDSVLDTAKQLWELIQQFELCIDYLLEHHLKLYCDTFSYTFTQCQTKCQLLKENPGWSRCGFGKMPALSHDGNVYPCFRMLPKSNNLKDSTKYAQGTAVSLLKNEKTLRRLNKNSRACNMIIQEKCEKCSVFNVCPHCAADCVNEKGATLTKTTSVCNFTRLQVYFARKYWERIKQLHPVLYKKNTDYVVTKRSGRIIIISIRRNC
jgi:uncharacterized protein